MIREEYGDFAIDSRYSGTITKWVGEIYHLDKLIYTTAEFDNESDARKTALAYITSSFTELFSGVYLNESTHNIVDHTTALNSAVIDDLGDVAITQPSNNNLLVFNGTAWVNSAQSAVDHGSITGLGDDDHTQYLNNTRHNSLDHSIALNSAVIDDLGDVIITSPSSSHILRYNGASWENVAQTGIDHGSISGLADDDHSQYQLRSEKSNASGYASLDISTKVPIAELPTGTTSTTLCIGNDSRLSNSRTPSGSAGGALSGTYPNPDLAASVAGTGLVITSNVLSVNAGTGLEVDATTDTVRISAAAAGAGLIGGGTSVLAVGAGTGITVNANDVAIDTSLISLGAPLTYTPTLSQSTGNTAISKTVVIAEYYYHGEYVFVTIGISVTGTGVSGNAIKVGLPVAINSVYVNNYMILGYGTFYDSSVQNLYKGSVECDPTFTNANVTAVLKRSDALQGVGYIGSDPALAITSGDGISMWLRYRKA